MKTIKLTNGKVAQVDDEDYEYLNKYTWRVSAKKHTDYAISTIKGKGVKMHRVILGLNSTDKSSADHIDHNGLNNQRSNLRKCTHAENMRNKSSQKNSTSKYLGVNKSTMKKGERVNVYWRADIRVDGKPKFLGYFPFTKEGEVCAAIVRNEAAIKYHGEFASLNII